MASSCYMTAESYEVYVSFFEVPHSTGSHCLTRPRVAFSAQRPVRRPCLQSPSDGSIRYSLQATGKASMILSSGPYLSDSAQRRTTAILRLYVDIRILSHVYTAPTAAPSTCSSSQLFRLSPSTTPIRTSSTSSSISSKAPRINHTNSVIFTALLYLFATLSAHSWHHRRCYGDAGGMSPLITC